MNARFYLFLLIGCPLVFAGCNHDQTKTPAIPAALPLAAKHPALTDPFRYHKLIEVSPGQDYDILSWGRGSVAVGGFLILHSDSSGKKYTTTTGDLDGSIVDVYNSDMDLDGNPEILIQAKATDTASYATIYAFEFDNSKANKLDFPKLTKSQRAGYMGNDNFYIKEGKFIREFPVYHSDGKDAKPTGQKRILEYGLRSNSFTLKQLSTDSTDKSAVKSAASLPVKASSSSKKETTSKKKSKKQPAEKKSKKKKHRKHRSDEDNN